MMRGAPSSSRSIFVVSIICSFSSFTEEAVAEQAVKSKARAAVDNFILLLFVVVVVVVG
jgi:hypothetical protein